MNNFLGKWMRIDQFTFLGQLIIKILFTNAFALQYIIYHIFDRFLSEGFIFWRAIAEFWFEPVFDFIMLEIIPKSLISISSLKKATSKSTLGWLRSFSNFKINGNSILRTFGPFTSDVIKQILSAVITLFWAFESDKIKHDDWISIWVTWFVDFAWAKYPLSLCVLTFKWMRLISIREKYFWILDILSKIDRRRFHKVHLDYLNSHHLRL